MRASVLSYIPFFSCAFRIPLKGSLGALHSISLSLSLSLSLSRPGTIAFIVSRYVNRKTNKRRRGGATQRKPPRRLLWRVIFIPWFLIKEYNIVGAPKQDLSLAFALAAAAVVNYRSHKGKRAKRERRIFAGAEHGSRNHLRSGPQSVYEINPSVVFNREINFFVISHSLLFIIEN